MSQSGVISSIGGGGGTVPVSGGGTGTTSFTPYMPITGGTTSTGALQSVTTGTIGQVLQYQGASTLPVWASSILGSTTGITPDNGYNGEVMPVLSISTTWTTSPASPVGASVTLTPGNWLLVGQFVCDSHAITSFNCGFSTIIQSSINLVFNQGTTNTSSSITVPAIRQYSVNSPITVYAVGYLGAGGTATGRCSFWAIRIG